LAKVTHCKLGYFLFFVVGLYLLLSFFRVIVLIYFLPQIVQILDIPSTTTLNRKSSLSKL
jgi:hypothetical protein